MNGDALTLQGLYLLGKKQLSGLPGGEDNSPMEAQFLWEKALGLDRRERLLRGNDPAPEEGAAAFFDLIRRRLAGEPLQYLLGEWEFYGLPFEVGPGVLIPRPETELLVDRALAAAEGRPSPALLDLCSGSGCVPVALGKKLPGAKIWGVELSPEALGYFRRNIQRNRAENVFAVAGDVFAMPEEVTGRRYRVITANPPYIPRGELASLQAEVRREPALALDGGADGLDFYRRLPALCFPLLEPGGLLVFEIGEGQGQAVAGLLREAGYQDIRVNRDLSGLERQAEGRRPSRETGRTSLP